jgi:ubiquitin carboxyl-terminal hydrolase 4/11/15
LLTLEVFNHRFYKNLDDNVLCGDMVDNDQIFCFELPCNSRQSRSYKPKENDPFILPVILTDVIPSRPAYSNYSRGTNNFGCPFIVVIERYQAKSEDAMYDAVIERLQRWTIHDRDLYTWQADPSPSDAVTIPISTVSPIDSVAEIKENGDVSEVDGMVIESDIADQRNLGEDDSGMEPDAYIVGTKQGVFNLRLYTGYKDYTAGGYGSSNGRSEQWETRIEDMGSGAPLLKEGDAFLCEFDENMKAYYFGTSQFENSRWDEWPPFIHPEYSKAKEAAVAQKSKGITLDDCLAEFTKEEQLGEDDLWYCPRCKKHQQATKKFDLWKVPDILAVHLKRFSNSRTLRDKIDTFVDFPIEDLDLTALVGERRVGTRLAQDGVDINELGIRDVKEPLIYDLYAVDEHLGGLGGGHYRAYALNHVTEQWYHFDDSYVTRSDASHAVVRVISALFSRQLTIFKEFQRLLVIL